MLHRRGCDIWRARVWVAVLGYRTQRMGDIGLAAIYVSASS